jgi:FlaA1/EpsC-like NDP-sugar epimerase
MADLISKDQILKIASLSRRNKRIVMVLADLIALPLALWSGFALRLSEWWPQEYLFASWKLFLLLPLIGVFIFIRLGLYRAIVRFMGAQAIWAVSKGVFLLALVLWSAAFVFQINPFPRSIPITFALVALVYVGGSRLLVRNFYHWAVKHYENKEAVLIYGAGGTGIQLATALSDGKEFYPVGFIDDDKALWGSTIKSLHVYNPNKIIDLIESSSIRHVLLAVADASNYQRKKMLEKFEGCNVHIQTIPSMPELLSGKASIDQIREVQIEELLGRDAVASMSSLMTKCITGKMVLVTGAGGSIGSELCRKIIQQKPKGIVLLESSEYFLYKIEKELNELLNVESINTNIYALLGSVTNRNRIANLINHFSVDTIYHAAAYKHVPIVEHNVLEGVSNNIFGTQVVAEEAAKAGVSHFILISTDKAVRPTNVMGATKRFAEMILQQLATTKTQTIFSMVRFGNVLGSSGSVVPLFREQIKQGGPVTVTHKEITRFFMTIPEAASLVIQAGSMAEGGDVFVLDMGEPVKVSDLAKQMIHLSGLELKTEKNPDGDIEIQYTGLRPAEKLFEELLIGENVVGTEHSKIMRANEEYLDMDTLNGYLSEIQAAIATLDHSKVRDILEKAVKGYRPHDSLVDHLVRKEATTNPHKNNIINLR